MTSEEAHSIWADAIRGLELEFNNEGGGLLDRLLGVNEFKRWSWVSLEDETPMPEQLKEVVRKLAGPHGRTILKAYRIKRGLE